MAHIRQSRPDSGLGSQTKVPAMLYVAPALLGGVAPDVEVLYFHIGMLRLFENLVFPKPFIRP